MNTNFWKFGLIWRYHTPANAKCTDADLDYRIIWVKTDGFTRYFLVSNKTRYRKNA